MPESAGTSDSHWTVVNSLFVSLASDKKLRPNYTWGVAHAASIAARTGRERISVLEFGVAGGNGLIALEEAAAAAEAALGVAVDVYGFDTGEGLPAPRDHRDAPFIMEGGDFPMDRARLEARLSRAQLVLGDVVDTIPRFIAGEPARVGFAAFDLDYWSSTRDALQLLRGPAEVLLPRVLCYFDDVHWYPWGDYNGARLAIREYNDEGEDRKLARLHGLRYLLPPSEFKQLWPDAMYVAHAFDHPAYAEPEGTEFVRRLDMPPDAPPGEGS